MCRRLASVWLLDVRLYLCAPQAWWPSALEVSGVPSVNSVGTSVVDLNSRRLSNGYFHWPTRPAVRGLLTLDEDEA